VSSLAEESTHASLYEYVDCKWINEQLLRANGVGKQGRTESTQPNERSLDPSVPVSCMHDTARAEDDSDGGED
jgi:hypothetical protein